MEEYVKKIIWHMSHYALGNIIVTLSFFVSFPIFTRVFSQSEYGIMSIIGITISLLSSVTLVGFPQAAVRFYSTKNEEKTRYTSTLVIGVIITSSVAIFLFLFLSFFLLSFFDRYIINLIRFSIFAVLFSNITSIFLAIVRSSQRTKLFNILNVLKTYIPLFFSLLLILGFHMGVFGRFLGMIIGLILVCFIFYFIFKRDFGISINKNKFSKPLWKEMFLYGYAFSFSAILSMLMTSGDRYVIQYYLGSAQVGIYSVGYQLPIQIQMLIVSPLNLAIFPIVMEIWNKKGKKAVQNFLHKLLKYYSMLAIPVTFGFISISKDIITVFATEKFLGAEKIIPFIITSIILYGGYFITYAGLMIYKKTNIIVKFLLIAVILNLALNILLVPIIGIVGAAIATLISYLFYTLYISFKSFNFLSFKIDYFAMVKYTTISAIMFFIIKNLRMDVSLYSLILKIVVGIIFYTLLLTLLEKDIQKIILSFIYKK